VQNAHPQLRREQTARVQDRSEQTAQAPWSLRTSGWLD
jgi:hypothetical protein